MTAASSTLGSPSYTVDAQGRRVKKTVSGTTTDYFYVGADLIAEKTGSTWKDYIFFAGQRMAEQTGSTAASAIYLHTDHLGSTRRCTNADGSSAGTCDYEPFGENQPGTSCSVPTRFRFAGMDFDANTNFYHTWFREYDPNQGRWMAVDPLPGSEDDPQTRNRYVYVRNDPINFIDPLGLKCYMVTESGDGEGQESIEAPEYTDQTSCEAHGGTWAPDVSVTITVTPPGSGGETTGGSGSTDVVIIFVNHPSDISPRGGVTGDNSRGGNSSGGGSTLDDRANALAKAVNATGIQVLNPRGHLPANVCAAGKPIVGGYGGASLGVRLGLLPSATIFTNPYVFGAFGVAGLVFLVGCP
ncbi:MAG: hypothetical protein M1453_00390 [Acidobacteria bacterium]|nr:hypothetical protein [Acidobacteriota bacterium]MCL5286445.1 hypothetical protein [Acidobacteriota bacterium]